jgi:TorA maturation chaperone TorD
LAEVEHAIDVADEDQLRANCYALLGRLLACAPDAQTLAMVGNLTGDSSDFGRALSALSSAARSASQQSLEEEYFNLFIGVGQGELTPYGSYYMTGFLHEKPLAALRADMGRLGIARVEGVSEPEDHIAALCEMMAGLITGAFADPGDLATQREFFEKHLAPWAPRFFEDLQATRSAAFYMPVGRIGQLFMEVEKQAFDMTA